MRKSLTIGTVLFVLAAAAIVVYLFRGDIHSVRLGQEDVRVDLAVTDVERQTGLSGREILGENEGMLFIFPTDGKHAIWMKDMLIPIDIVWISSEKLVVDIERSVSPESFPESFSPESDARYVLELPAGWTTKRGISIGDYVSFQR